MISKAQQQQSQYKRVAHPATAEDRAQQQKALFKACREGDVGQVKRILEQAKREETLPALLAAKDKDGLTPLHEAARGGHTDVAIALLEAKADLNAANIYDQTPLHYAASGGHTKIVRLLLNPGEEIAGANTKAKDNDDNTPLHYAAWGGHTETVKILLEAGADPKATDNDGRTPLHLAVMLGLKDIAKALLESGADIDAADEHGRTPLHLAAYNGHTKIVVMLLRNHAVIPRELIDRPIVQQCLNQSCNDAPLSTRNRARLLLRYQIHDGNKRRSISRAIAKCMPLNMMYRKNGNGDLVWRGRT